MKGCRPRVLLLQPAFGQGGVDQTRALLVSELDLDRHDVEVCCLHSASGDFLPFVERKGVPVHTLGVPFRRYRWLIGDPRLTRALFRLMRARHYDVVQSVGFTCDWHGRLAACAAGVPVKLVEIRAEYGTCAEYWPYLPFDFALARVTDAFMTVSQAVARQVMRKLHLPPGRCFPFHNRVNPARLLQTRPREAVRAELGIPADAFLVGAIGELHWRKGHEFLLRALPAVAARIPSLRVVLVGQGILKDSLTRLADRLRVADRVCFVGWRSDVGDLLHSLDLLAMPSLSEAWGNAAAEALWCGVPVVASSVGGLPEIVAEGCGALVPPRDAARLAEAIVALAADATRLDMAASQARRHARAHLALEGYAQQFQDLWDTCLQAKGLAGRGLASSAQEAGAAVARRVMAGTGTDHGGGLTSR